MELLWKGMQAFSFLGPLLEAGAWRSDAWICKILDLKKQLEWTRDLDQLTR